ncbi:MAG TPA: hypothetical protein H9903_08885 [Candidatus Aquabacterium excrementipullorum]|nr:hypothetical protein [Candidatus Aquabacterium excrementipullorum]
MAKLFSVVFGGLALLLGAVTTIVFLQAVADGVADQTTVLVFVLYMVAPVLCGLAAFAISRRKPWGRWVLLLISLLCISPLPLIAPDIIALIRHYRAPPPGAYAVLTAAQFQKFLLDLLLAPLLSAFMALAATLWGFQYLKPAPTKAPGTD